MHAAIMLFYRKIFLVITITAMIPVITYTPVNTRGGNVSVWNWSTLPSSLSQPIMTNSNRSQNINYGSPISPNMANGYDPANGFASPIKGLPHIIPGVNDGIIRNNVVNGVYFPSPFGGPPNTAILRGAPPNTAILRGGPPNTAILRGGPPTH